MSHLRLPSPLPLHQNLSDDDDDDDSTDSDDDAQQQPSRPHSISILRRGNSHSPGKSPSPSSNDEKDELSFGRSILNDAQHLRNTNGNGNGNGTSHATETEGDGVAIFSALYTTPNPKSSSSMRTSPAFSSPCSSSTIALKLFSPLLQNSPFSANNVLYSPESPSSSPTPESAANSQRFAGSPAAAPFSLSSNGTAIPPLDSPTLRHSLSLDSLFASVASSTSGSTGVALANPASAAAVSVSAVANAVNGLNTNSPTLASRPLISSISYPNGLSPLPRATPLSSKRSNRRRSSELRSKFSKNSPLLSLSDTLQLHIFSFLTFSSMPALSVCAHEFHSLFLSNFWIWKCYFLMEFPHSKVNDGPFLPMYPVYLEDTVCEKIPWKLALKKRIEMRKWCSVKFFSQRKERPNYPSLRNGLLVQSVNHSADDDLKTVNGNASGRHSNRNAARSASAALTVSPSLSPSASPPQRSGSPTITSMPPLTLGAPHSDRTIHQPAASPSSSPRIAASPIPLCPPPLGSSLSSSTPSLSNPPLILRGHREAVSAIRFDPSTLVYSSGNSLRIHSLSNGRSLGNIKAHTTGTITSLDFNHSIVISCSTDCTIRTFDWQTFEMKRVTTRKKGHADSVTDVKLLGNDGRKMLSCSLDATSKLWDTESGQCITTFNENDQGKLGWILSMAHINDNEFLTVSTRKVHQLPAENSPANAAPTIAMESKLTYWDSRTPNGIVHSVLPRSTILSAVSACMQTNSVAAGAADGSVRLYDVRSLHVNRPLFIGPAAMPTFSSALQTAYNANPSAQKSHIQSIHIDADRILVCQRRSICVHQAANGSPDEVSGLPFSFLITQFTLDHAQQIVQSMPNPSFINSSSTGSPVLSGSAGNSSSPASTSASSSLSSFFPFFNTVRYDRDSDILAVGMTDSVLVWNSHQKKTVSEVDSGVLRTRFDFNDLNGSPELLHSIAAASPQPDRNAGNASAVLSGGSGGRRSSRNSHDRERRDGRARENRRRKPKKKGEERMRAAGGRGGGGNSNTGKYQQEDSESEEDDALGRDERKRNKRR